VIAPPPVHGYLNAEIPPTPEEITEAFWSACHGDQRQVAELLLRRGADINWVGWDDLTPLDAARRSDAGDLAAWLDELQGGHTPGSADPAPKVREGRSPHTWVPRRPSTARGSGGRLRSSSGYSSEGR